MTTLTQSMRRSVVERTLETITLPREAAFTRTENALALRLVMHRYGNDVFDRCRALPEGWLGLHKELSLETELCKMLPQPQEVVPRMRYSLRLSEAAVLPNSTRFGWTREVIGPHFAAVHELWRERADFYDDLRLLRRQVEATTAAYRTVEKLAAGWPEGYAQLPQEMLQVSNLPAPRISDLNARIEAMRQAA